MVNGKVKKHLCKICNKLFGSPADLKRHIDGVHLKIRPHKCTKCNQSFTLLNTLVLHMRTHTKERPFICKFKDCKKSFSTSSYLACHYRRHENEKPYIWII